MSALLIITMLIALAIPLAQYARAYRLRKVEEMRLHMSRSVTQMEAHMLTGTIKLGDVCHDSVFHTMYRAQFLSTYPIPYAHRRLTKEQKQYSEKLFEELKGGESPAMRPLIEFIDAYYGALFYSHPAKVLGYTISILSLRVVQKVIRGQLTMIGNWATIWRNARRRVTTQSVSRILDDNVDGAAAA